MNVYSIITTILVVVLGFIASYVKAKGNVMHKVGEMINQAEYMYKDTTGKGGEKFQLVCQWIYEMLPSFLRPFITQDVIGNIVQFVFDKMTDFAVMQLNKVVDPLVDESAEEDDYDELIEDAGQ